MRLFCTYTGMIPLLIIIGFISTTIAAAAPGPVNIAVIEASLKQNKKTKAIITGAGLGEVVLAFIALQYTMKLASFFEANPWIQISVFLLFVLVGLYFIYRDTFNIPKVKRSISLLKQSGFAKGFLLASLNPTVLLFWVLAFGFYHLVAIDISVMSDTLELVLFFSAVFLGKTTVLLGYSFFVKKHSQQTMQDKSKLYKGIGVALTTLGIVQAIKFVVF